MRRSYDPPPATRAPSSTCGEPPRTTFFLYDGAIVRDPEGIITAGHDNTTARTVAIRQDETINTPALTAILTHIIANNRAGGWRKLKRQS